MSIVTILFGLGIKLLNSCKTKVKSIVSKPTIMTKSDAMLFECGRIIGYLLMGFFIGFGVTVFWVWVVFALGLNDGTIIGVKNNNDIDELKRYIMTLSKCNTTVKNSELQHKLLATLDIFPEKIATIDVDNTIKTEPDSDGDIINVMRVP